LAYPRELVRNLASIRAFRGTLRLRLLLLALAGAYLSGTSLAAGTPTMLRISPYSGKLATVGVTTAKGPAKFLLDTAGGVTVITPDLATRTGCAPWARLTGFRMRGDRLDLPRCDNFVLRIARRPTAIGTVGVWDLMNYFPSGSPLLAGSLAMDAFRNTAITLDLGRGTLIIESRESLGRRVRDAVEVPAHFAQEAEGFGLTPLVGVQTARGLLWMELDSASDGDFNIAAHATDVLNVVPAGRKATTKLTLGHGVTLVGRAAVRDMIIDGNIGAPQLKKWLITIDFVSRRIWFKSAQSASSDKLAGVHIAGTGRPGRRTRR
jgi:hypothetical protein